MKKRVISYVILGLFAYLGLLLASFPADRAMALLKTQLPEQMRDIRVAGVSGSIWSGRIDVLQYRDQSLEKLSWSIKPWSLLTGQLGIALSLGGKDINGQADVFVGLDGQIEISELDFRVFGDRLSTLLALPVNLGGQFSGRFDELVLQNRIPLQATGELSWQRAAIISPIEQSLGEFKAEVSTLDSGIHADVSDVKGPLQLKAGIDLDAEGRYQLKGNLLVRDRQQNLLVQGVRSLGRAAADGRVALDYSGSL